MSHQIPATLGNSGSGIDTNQLELVLPVVELSANADNLEWIGLETFDFTKYEALIWFLNGKPTTYNQLYGLVDGVSGGYYSSQEQHLNGGGTATQEDNSADWRIDPSNYMSGNDVDISAWGKFTKNKISNRIKGTYEFNFSNGRIQGDVTVNSTKIDKFKIKSNRNGFGDLWNPWIAGSTLTVYGLKKS